MAKLEDFGIERDPVIERYKQDVDVTLIDENLKRSVEERCRIAIGAHRSMRELRRAGEEMRAKQRAARS